MKKILSLYFIGLNYLIFYTQQSLILEPTKDTYINSVVPNQIQGTTQSNIASRWTYGGQEGSGRSLLGFELCDLPPNFNLVSATLHLFHDYSGSHIGHTTNGSDAKLFKITSNWDESTTWSNQPTFDLNVFSVISGAISENQNYSIDVTQIVNSTISNTNNVGFYLKLDNESIYRSLVFASKNHPDNSVRPKLELIYYSDNIWCSNSSIINANCISKIQIPNVFTPNLDSINSNFQINSSCSLENFKIDILNRWGNIVFHANNIDFHWNGKNNTTGMDCSEGTYFYYITYDIEGQNNSKSGFITLIK